MAEPTDGDDGGVPPPGAGKDVTFLPADGLFPVIRHRVDALVEVETRSEEHTSELQSH